MNKATIKKLKEIRDSWKDEHIIAVEATNRALAHERRALRRFQQADAAVRKMEEPTR